MNKIQSELFAMQDEKYRDFQARLLPTVSRDSIIGIRTPKLREYAKKIKDSEDVNAFLGSLPHAYYEENNLHAFLIEQIKDYDTCIVEINRFLPYIDNWATCDSLSPKCFKKNTDVLLGEVEKWLNSPHAYTVRFGIEMLMKYYLDDKFDESFPERVSRIKSNEYYVNMMIAWYFATALTKRWDSVIYFIEESLISPVARKMAIRKGIESLAIPKERKAYLRELSRN